MTEFTKFTEAEMKQLKNVRFLTATHRIAEFHYTDSWGNMYALGYIEQPNACNCC